MQILSRLNQKLFIKILKSVSFLIGALGSFYAAQVLADDNIGNLAANISTYSYAGIGKLMIGTAYLAGIGFTIAAIFKFKQHRDNPTQIPIGTPLALLVIGVVLVFLPGIIKPAGVTIFGGNAATSAGGFTGGNVNTLLPGN